MILNIFFIDNLNFLDSEVRKRQKEDKPYSYFGKDSNISNKSLANELKMIIHRILFITYLTGENDLFLNLGTLLLTSAGVTGLLCVPGLSTNLF